MSAQDGDREQRGSVVANEPGAWFASVLAGLIGRRPMSAGQTREIFDRLFDGDLSDTETATLLVALRMRGESADELAAAARSLRARMVAFPTDGEDVLDTCGTG